MQVEDLLTKKKLDYVPSGKDVRILCLNPEHDDSDPSLRIDRITGIMHCFSCGFGGNIFDYFEEKGNRLMIKRELLKKKIAEKLRENIGLNMPEGTVPFNQEWRNIRAETYRKFEAFQHHDSDFIGRVVFPIRNISGKIVAFNGRHLTLNHTPRYIVSPRSAKLPLFPVVKPVQGRIMLVEGIFDMLNLHDKGIINAVCAFGTRQITPEKLKLLKVQGVTGIDIFFDQDDAGNTAAQKVREMAEELEVDTRIVKMAKSDVDPGELTALQVIKLKEAFYG